MPRLLSKVSGAKSFGAKTNGDIYERYSFNEADEDEQLELLPNFSFETKDGFYKTSSGKKIFSFYGKCYQGTGEMSAWCYYNFATNLKKKKMNGDQYHFWRVKMQDEGKGYLLYD